MEDFTVKEQSSAKKSWVLSISTFVLFANYFFDDGIYWMDSKSKRYGRDCIW